MSTEKSEKNNLRNKTIAISLVVILSISIMTFLFLSSKQPNTGGANTSYSTGESSSMENRAYELKDFYGKYKPRITIGDYMDAVRPGRLEVVGSGILRFKYKLENGAIFLPSIDLNEPIYRIAFTSTSPVPKKYFAEEQEKVLSFKDIQDIKQGVSMSEIVSLLGRPKFEEDNYEYTLSYYLDNGKIASFLFLGEDYLETVIILYPYSDPDKYEYLWE